MGLFKRKPENFWGYVALLRHERPVNYAHLRCVSGRENLGGTLYLTDQRLLWRAGDPKRSRDGFTVELGDVVQLATPRDGVGTADRPAFQLGLRLGGQLGALLFYPFHPREPANVELARQMYGSIRAELIRYAEANGKPHTTAHGEA